MGRSGFVILLRSWGILGLQMSWEGLADVDKVTMEGKCVY